MSRGSDDYQSLEIAVPQKHGRRECKDGQDYPHPEVKPPCNERSKVAYFQVNKLRDPGGTLRRKVQARGVPGLQVSYRACDMQADLERFHHPTCRD